MSFTLGNIEEERKNDNRRGKEGETPPSEVCVYSGEKCILACYGRVETFENGATVKIRSTDGRVYIVYNGVVIVKERQ